MKAYWLHIVLALMASIFLSAGGACAQSPGENWFRSYVFLYSTGTESHARETKVYYDGLGRLTEARSTDGTMAEITDMDLDAKVRGVTRRYLNSNVQDAVISYDGALPTSVRDMSTPYYVEAVGRFAAGDYAMAHDALGRLTSDGTRGVQAVTYVSWGNLPKHITMDNGDYTDNAYLPDGTLISRIFNTKRIVTVTTVNAKSDTIVRQRRQDVRTTHQYYGPWEVTSGAENSTRLHTAYGYYDYAAGAHRWYLRNRQGSVMAVTDGNGNVLQRSGVYPGGTPFSVDYNAEATPSLTAATDRLHIGNSWMSHSGLNWYDNTARMHDPLLMRFTTPDALATDYPSLSPWAHCAGNPANLTDPDGNVIIFINGFHTGDGGTSKYWCGVDRICMDVRHDYHAMYIDGSCGGALNMFAYNMNPYIHYSSNDNLTIRYDSGFSDGKQRAHSIIRSLKRDEKITLVTHSMGTAFGRGFVSGFKEYCDENDINPRDYLTVELDLAPYQAAGLPADKDITTYRLSHKNDFWAGNMNMSGADDNHVDNKSNADNHSIKSFVKEEIRVAFQALETKYQSKNY